ncbi:MAG: glycosyltransferase [Myxococcota bacterium]
MRIAYVSDQLLPQTATDTAQLVSMTSALASAGAEVDLVIPGRWARTEPGAEAIAAHYEVAPTFSVHRVRSLAPNPVRGLEKLGHAAAACAKAFVRDADVVYTRNLPVVLAALRLTDRPVIYETYRPWPDQSRRMKMLFRRLRREPRFAGAILHSELAASSYRRLGFEDERLLVAHNGYDPDLVGEPVHQEVARLRLGLPVDRPVAVYAGHVSPDKGIGLLLDMVEALPDVHLVLVGSKGRGPIERRAEGMPNVTVVGWQAFRDTVPYLYAADVLLIPPTRGPLERVGNTVLPIKTFLYMATGRAILAPDGPDLREVLVDGENARLVPPDAPAAAVAALRGLVEDDALRERLGEAARADAAARTWLRRAERVLCFLEERLEVRRGRG